MDELTRLAIKYGTDKWGKHKYTPVYHQMFKNRRAGSDVDYVENVLEIGVGEGASLFMWRDYFFKAHIYGLDNDFYRVFKAEAITVFLGDQSNGEDLERVMKSALTFDLI